PGWYLSSVLHVVGIVVMVDLVMGPTLTLIVANPGKRRRTFARDVAVIVTVQLAALVYGTVTLWSGRPLYYAFSVNSLDCVQASDIDASDAAVALRQNPMLAPHWYSLPRWIWAPLPDDPNEAMQIVNGATFGSGKDVVDMPRYFKPWREGLPKLREQLVRLDDLIYLNKAEKQSLHARLSARGLAPDQRNTLIMWGGSRSLLAIFDPTTLQLKALLRTDVD
ncbi:MAG TPA: hypothetical protein VKB20_03355, partial [Steroidobacteraceae bacterium]|nr:hypothetical protein [Steroidobacteraceae bacterium]